MRLTVTLVVFCLAGALTARAQTGPLLPWKSAHWKQTITSKGAAPEDPMKVVAELWYQGPDRMRVVTAVDGKSQVIVIKSGTAFLYQEGSDTGVKLPLQQQMLESLAQVAEIHAKLRSSEKSKVGTEKIGDKNCDVYAFTENISGKPVSRKIWLWTKQEFPIRILVESPGQSVLIEHCDVEINGEVPAAIFELPPKLKFNEVPAARGTVK